MSHPLINHISVPYTARLLSELQPPQTLLIQGNVLPDANRFAINLLSDCTEVNPHMGSVPLHVNIRFDENSIVLNSFNAGEWEKEERHSNPFNRGEPFDIRIRVHEERFELIANKQHLADFKHRYSFRKIDHMQIIGDITLSTVHWGGRYFEMPFQSTFHGDSLKSGQRVFVYSIAKGDFSVNFVGENGDMLFHLNPRFTENQVFINGNHYCTFAHRIEDPNNEYKFLRIEGNIELTGVEVSQ